MEKSALTCSGLRTVEGLGQLSLDAVASVGTPQHGMFQQVDELHLLTECYKVARCRSDNMLAPVGASSLGFDVWGLNITAHAPFKCRNRSRPALVQRKRSHEKRRGHRTLKSHTLLKCQNRSRIAFVERKRSHDITQVQKG